jgi:hypothetical protein
MPGMPQCWNVEKTRPDMSLEFDIRGISAFQHFLFYSPL